MLALALQLRFDAGSPALDLCATVGRRRSGHPLERLTDPERARAWLGGAGLPDVPIQDDDLADLRRLREAGHHVVGSRIPGWEIMASAADVEMVSSWSRRALPGPWLVRDPDGVRAREPEATFETVLVGLAREFVSLAATGDERLRACDGSDCGMLYLDASRGRRRRWCSMGRCGNRAKVSRFREADSGARGSS